MKMQLMAKAAFVAALAGGCATGKTAGTAPQTAATAPRPEPTPYLNIIPVPLQSLPPEISDRPALPGEDPQERVSFNIKDGIVIDHCGPEFLRIVDATTGNLCLQGKTMQCKEWSTLTEAEKDYFNVMRQALDKRAGKRPAARETPVPPLPPGLEKF